MNRKNFIMTYSSAQTSPEGYEIPYVDVHRIATALERIADILESNVHISIDHAHIDEIDHNHVEGKIHTHEDKW